MPLPININELITGATVEWERIEFKKGWNPEVILHSICAFANDINNWGGGYIILGIEENKGKPILPPVGLSQSKLDDYQKKLIELGHRLTPDYFPIIQPEIFKGSHILIIWVPGGDNRPYKAPVYLSKKQSNYAYYVRRGSITKRAGNSEEKVLIELASKVPFDDRINQQADISDLNLSIIRSFLKEVKSRLYDEAAQLPFEELCRKMNIVKGSDERIQPINAGLLLFNENPEHFFRGAKIEVVQYKDRVGDNFVEKSFTGPIHIQLKEALRYIKNSIIKEEVIKQSGQAESDRFFNYPFAAIEEALANAVYHKSYDHESTIEVQVRYDCIEILSFRGPLPPLNKAMLKKDRIIARDYRNRRIGDFLKELHLTEGRGTGIPKIRMAMKDNGSPNPTFDTDQDNTYFLTTLPVHPRFADEKLTKKQLIILRFCNVPKSRNQILKKLSLSFQYANYKRHILPLLEQGLLTFTNPNTPTSKNQKYIITPKGTKRISSEK